MHRARKSQRDFRIFSEEKKEREKEERNSKKKEEEEEEEEGEEENTHSQHKYPVSSVKSCDSNYLLGGSASRGTPTLLTFTLEAHRTSLSDSLAFVLRLILLEQATG